MKFWEVKCLLLAVLLSGTALTAGATPIVYTEQAAVTGTLGGQAFSDALLTITFVGDTTNVVNAPPLIVIDATGTTFSIAGIGAGTITQPGMQIFVNQTFAPPAVGFGVVGQGSLLVTHDTSFGTYTLTTTIGPVTGPSFTRSDLNVATALGILNITSAGNATFTATTSSVPEPSSMYLVLAGLCLARGARWLDPYSPASPKRTHAKFGRFGDSYTTPKLRPPPARLTSKNSP